jgi:hypothetical protein
MVSITWNFLLIFHENTCKQMYTWDQDKLTDTLYIFTSTTWNFWSNIYPKEGKGGNLSGKISYEMFSQNKLVQFSS